MNTQFDAFVESANASVTMQVALYHVHPKGFAFAHTQDGEIAFVPASIVTACELKKGDVVTAKLIANYEHMQERAKYRAFHIVLDSDAPQPAPSSIKADILIHLRKCEAAYQTTSEIASAIGAGVIEARNVLMSMHRDGQIARADVFAKPDQSRASGTIWALTANDILG